MANSQVLKEYLLSLGFKVDESSANRFDTRLLKFDLNIGSLAKKVLGVATAAQVMVTVFARSMEKMYYSSQRANSTVGNMKALEYGTSRIGVSSETTRAALEGMARSIRAQPGLVGLLQSFGIQVEGRDMSDVALDMVKALKALPFYQAQQYAALFGIDADTLLLMQRGVEEIEKASAARKQMAADLGVDTDKAAEASKEYMNQLREIQEMFGLLKDVALIAMVEPMKEAAKVTSLVLKDWIQIIKTWNGWGDFGKRLWEGVTGRAGAPKVELSASAKARVAAGELGPSDKPQGDSQSMFNRLERHYNLPPGLLDKMWAKESARGTQMKSSAGALGHFQFMPATAKDEGLSDPMDLGQSAAAAAKYMAKLIARYKGDIQKALAAYNWGMGNVDKLGQPGAASMPWETQDYVKTLSGSPITMYNTTSISVTSPDPEAAGRAVASQQDRVNATLTRNMAGAIE